MMSVFSKQVSFKIYCKSQSDLHILETTDDLIIHSSLPGYFFHIIFFMVHFLFS
jgi:hypothetical protein